MCFKINQKPNQPTNQPTKNPPEVISLNIVKMDNSRAVFCSEVFYVSRSRVLRAQEAVCVLMLIIPIPFTDSLNPVNAASTLSV